MTSQRSDDVPIVQVEDLDRLVRRRCEKLRARGIHGNAQNRSLVPGENPQSRGLPDSYNLVRPTRNDRLAVSQHAHTANRRLVLSHALELSSGRSFPESHRLIGRARGDPIVIVRQEHRRDRPTVPCERRRDLPVRHVPHPCRFVVRPRYELGPIAAHAQAVDGITVPVEISQALSLSDVPEFGRPVRRCREQHVAILE